MRPLWQYLSRLLRETTPLERASVHITLAGNS
jgi:hypothetical protein